MTNTSLKSQSETCNGSSQEARPAPRLLVFGNALLDVTVIVNDDELLKKYNLERNGQAEVPLEKLNSLFNEARDRYKSFKISLGGSGLNSSRILAALNEKDLLFFGAIGCDKNGKLLKEYVKRSGVDACLQELEIRTGTVVCLCQGSDRSLVANVGAAMKCEKSFVEDRLDNFTAPPSFYYVEGFFIPDKMNICRALYERYHDSLNTRFITNLNAPYIVKTFQKDVTWMVNKADVIFGNRDEFEELANINGFEKIDDLFADLFSSYSKALWQKIIVVTDGSNDVVYYKGDANGIESSAINVPKVNEEDIVDTTGAGDSFVAGFLYELIRGKDIKECIEFGITISSQVIRTIGCNLPNRGVNEAT